MAQHDGPGRDTGVTLGEMGLERFAPYLLSRAINRWAEAIRDELREYDLSVNQMRALGALTVRGSQSIQELSQFTSTEPSTMSRTLDGLEKRGLVRREQRASDGRLRVVTLTDTGQTTFSALWPHLRERYEHMMEGIDGHERDAFLTTLGRIARNLERRSRADTNID